MKIAIGSDERTTLTDAVIAEVEKRGHTVLRYGPLDNREAYWPEVAQEILEAWFSTGYIPNDVDDACLAQVEAIEREYLNRTGR